MIKAAAVTAKHPTEQSVRVQTAVSPTLAAEAFRLRAEQERLRSMLSRGLRGFIPKPYNQTKLLTQIRSVLDTLGAERSGERRVL